MSTYAYRVPGCEAWGIVVNDVHVDATFNSEGAAKAGIQVEQRRAQRKAAAAARKRRDQMDGGLGRMDPDGYGHDDLGLSPDY